MPLSQELDEIEREGLTFAADDPGDISARTALRCIRALKRIRTLAELGDRHNGTTSLRTIDAAINAENDAE